MTGLGLLFGAECFAQSIGEPADALTRQSVKSCPTGKDHDANEIAVLSALLGRPWAICWNPVRTVDGLGGQVDDIAVDAWGAAGRLSLLRRHGGRIRLRVWTFAQVLLTRGQRERHGPVVQKNLLKNGFAGWTEWAG